MEYKPLEYFGSDGKIAQRMPDQWVFKKKCQISGEIV
jgi:hypothetical protein